MSRLVDINEYTQKNEKLEQIVDYLDELKEIFAEVVDEFDSDGEDPGLVDRLTEALDAIEDAYDGISDVISELE